MKNRRNAGLIVALVLALVAWGSATSSAQTARDPVTIVKMFYDAVNAGQLDRATSLFADDGLEVSPEGRFQGKEAARRYLKTLIDRGFRQENTKYRESKGEVRYDYKWYVGGALIGAGSDGLTIVKNGKIVFDGLEKDKPR